jgi:cell division protein FtsL
MEAFEYQIKKDIRNNPIVREVDEARSRELWQWTAVVAVFVVLLLFSAWQHFELIRYGYRLEQLQDAHDEEERRNRHLKLEVQALQRPQRIEEIARTQQRMKEPAPEDVIVLERVRPTAPPDKSVVARR